MVVGPLLALAYLVFLISWQRQQSDHMHSPGSTLQRDGFPVFGSPNDPLSCSWPDRSLAAIGGRLLWFAFLVAPIIIIAIMFLLRGNFISLIYSPGLAGDWFDRREFTQTGTWISLIIDTLNLLALWLAVACLLEITRVTVKRGEALHFGAFWVSILSKGLFLVAWIREFQRLIVEHIVGFGDEWSIRTLWSFLLYLGFGLIWSRALVQSIRRSTVVGGVIALAGFLLALASVAI